MEASIFYPVIIISAIGVFCTGFLKKAGEDIYSIIKAKIFPKSAQSSDPQVFINFHRKELAQPPQLIPIEVENLRQLSFSEIEKK